MTKKDKKPQRVNIKAKGRLKVLTFKLHALIWAYKKGLKTHKLIDHSEGRLELEFTGDREKLWEMVKWANKGGVLSTVEEVTFTFTDQKVR